MKKVIGTNKRHVMSASTLTRDSVVNSKGENLGTIEDIMIHIDSGRIAYAVLSFGGILGIGDKLFAVPWEAFTLDEDQHHFILNVDKQFLENAPGFDKDNWPDMADPQFKSRVYTFYGYDEPSWSSTEEGSVFTHHRGSEKEDCLQMGTC
ncbi:MAG: PRC-barrel domain containing protein [Desulfobacteraceae bacterium]|nr:MAG: PRC-barrel domain containing protein [Desulfobacteraceae bacterium]